MFKDKILNSSKESIMRMVLFAFFAFFIAILIAFSVIYVTAQKRYSLKFYEDILKRAVHTKSMQIRNYFEADLAILNAMSKSPIIISFLENSRDENIKNKFWKEFNNYKKLIGNNKNLFFVSKQDKNLYFGDGYTYIIEEELPSSYWYDSTLSKTKLYNFNVDHNLNLNVSLIWINFPVFNNNEAVGVLGVGIDIDSFAEELKKEVGNVGNFIIFNESNEIMLHKNHDLIKNKDNISSILPEELVGELLELSKEENNEMILRDDWAYVIETLPFMQCYLVAKIKTKFAVGLGNIYFTALVVIMISIFIFFAFLYKFIETIVNPLHYFSSLTRTILKDVPIHIAIFNDTGKTAFMSQQMNELLGKGKSNLSDYLKEIENKKGFFEATKEFEMDDGKSNYFKIIKMDVEQHNKNNEQNSIIYLSNVSEQMYLANTDVLTNIANRRYFNERAKTEFYNSQRDKTFIALLMLDIDFFKKFNDGFGHLAGDEILKKVADILNQVVVRKTDLVGRIGGEEFAIMLHNTNLEGARIVADRVRSAVENNDFLINNSEIVKITVSIGVYSAVPNSFDDLKLFLKEADKKLYEAKNSGRNRVCS